MRTGAALVGLWTLTLLFAAAIPTLLAQFNPSQVDEPLHITQHASGIGPEALASGGRIFVPRGSQVADFVAEPARFYRFESALSRPSFRQKHLTAVALLGATTGIAFFAFLHRLGGRYRHRRVVVGLFLWICLAVVCARASLTLAPVSAGWLPALAFILPVSIQLRPLVGFAVTLLLATATATLVPPFDPVIAGTILAQGMTVSVFKLRGSFSNWRTIYATTAMAMYAGVVGYLTAQWLCFGALDPSDLAAFEWGRLGAVAMGGLTLPLLGLALNPVLERLVGNLSRARLLELADLRNPLLQRIATRAPGSWAHSRMMANLAESAAHAVGADALLVRVGAYFHDLGKADEPEFFIENVRRAGRTGHAELGPYESAQRIIAHVVEGVRRGRAAGLPEDILDFMHTHHGSGRVEYFYQRALESAQEGEVVNPDDFSYPGRAPQTPETGILAIVDAVEAAARTLTSPTPESLNTMIRQIVFTKLSAGQLDESGLSSRDLRLICENLRESLLASAHERIVYPWQEKEQARAEVVATSLDLRSALDPEETPATALEGECRANSDDSPTEAPPSSTIRHQIRALEPEELVASPSVEEEGPSAAAHQTPIDDAAENPHEAWVAAAGAPPHWDDVSSPSISSHPSTDPPK